MDDLLQPSLADDELRPIYSIEAMMVAGFLGGPVAVALLWTLSARRLGSVGRDLPFVVALVAAALGLFYAFAEGLVEGGRAWIIGAGFLAVGCAWLRFRPQYRSQRIVGAEPPKPVLPVLCGFLLNVGLGFAVLLGLR